MPTPTETTAPRRMERRPRRGVGWKNWLILTAVLAVSAWWFHFRDPPGRADPAAGTVPAAVGPAPRPAMTVTAVRPTVEQWATRLTADGSVTAWQEVSISPEVGGLRLAEVRVNVGDRVVRGDTLAVLAANSVEIERAEQAAALAEAKAALAEASADAARARQLRESGALSAQQIAQYLTVETTARARLQAAEARLRSQDLRLSQTRIVAPDDGVIAVRAATVGAVAQAGQELFRLIRQGRLEWRADVPASELSLIAPRQNVEITLPDGNRVIGTVRTVAPTIDPQTRNGLVYVDLPTGGAAVRAGMFARGSFLLGSSAALTVPAGGVLLRDGFSYLFTIGGDGTVAMTKVRTGRRQGDRVEILDGLAPEDSVVESGAGFLADGDTVAVARGIQ